jgi:lipopolysaccharide/colanic/teichoic acid biosynthesis glycosyltransferase
MVGDAWRHHSALSGFERLRDVAVASGLILLCLPLMLLVAIAIKCDSRGRALSWQPRVGPRGYRFWACRFRIRIDGENPRSCEAQALTSVGDLIHRCRIDALPQLLNVLRGEMTCAPGDPERPFFFD